MVMYEPKIHHFYVKINNSYVHLTQYGDNEKIIQSTSETTLLCNNSFVSKNNESFLNNSKSSVTSSGISISTNSTTCSNQESNDVKLVIFIPGNPGILGVYHDFLIKLYKNLKEPSDKSNSLYILAIGHNNFDHPDHCDYRTDERICIEDNELSLLDKCKLEKSRDPHDIELQVLNKLIILQKLLKFNLKQANENNVKLVFVGHSIGCYVILRLLQDKSIAKLHNGSILVHPALENLATTNKGAVIANYFAFKLDYAMRLAAYLAENLLPKSLILKVTKWTCSPELVAVSSTEFLDSMAQMVCSKTLNALVEMAKSELVKVKNLDHENMIKPHTDKLKLIYAKADHWVNQASPLELSSLYPELYIEHQDTLHAFIMEPGTVINYALKIGIFIEEMFEY